MQRSLLFVLVSVITVCSIGVAHGKARQGVTCPEQAQLDGGTLTLNGLGLRQATILQVNVSVAPLSVANISSDPSPGHAGLQPGSQATLQRGAPRENPTREDQLCNAPHWQPSCWSWG